MNGQSAKRKREEATPGVRPAPGNSKYLLQVHPNPPKMVLVNQYFPLTVTLLDRLGKPVDVHSGLPLQMELIYIDTHALVEQSAAMLELDREPVLDRSGVAQLNVRLRQSASERGIKNFQIRFGLARTEHAIALGPVESVLTAPFHVVSYRLRTLESPPADWFKDEGGRDKSMTVVVQLEDGDGRVVTNSDLPLKAVLVYDTADVPEVKTQHILKFIQMDSPVRIGSDGKCTLRFRIEEVSKNHQKQNFRLKVLADPSHPLANDVAPDISGGVNVKSKRRRLKAEPVKSKGRQGGAGDASTKRTVLRPPTASAPPPMLSAPAIGNNPPAMPVVLPDLRRPGSSGNPISLAGAARPSINDSFGGAGRGSIMIPGYDGRAGAGAGTSQSSGVSMSNAVTGVISWTHFVVDELRKIQFQHVGYEMDQATNQIDHSKLIYKCPGCHVYKTEAVQNPHSADCFISRAITFYDLTVNDLLQALVQFSDKNSMQRGDPMQADVAGPAGSASGADVAMTGSSLDGVVQAQLTAQSSVGKSDMMDPLRVPSLNRNFTVSDFMAFNDATPLPGGLGNLGNLPASSPLSRANSINRLGSFNVFNALPVGNPTLSTALSQQGPLALTMNNTMPMVIDSTSSQEVPMSSDERSVFGVLLQQVEGLGFPAFNAQSDLVGFYRLDEKAQGMEFQSLGVLPALTSDLLKDLSNRYAQGNNVMTLGQKVTVALLRNDLYMSVYGHNQTL